MTGGSAESPSVLNLMPAGAPQIGVSEFGGPSFGASIATNQGDHAVVHHTAGSLNLPNAFHIGRQGNAIYNLGGAAEFRVIAEGELVLGQ